MKKKGFTLVELLAVIIILAIIALIAIPAIMDSIEKAKRNAFKDSVYQTFQEVESYLVKNNLKEIPEEGIDVKDIEFKNNIFVSGKLIISQSGNVKAVNVGDGKYCAIGEKDALEIFDGECDLSIPTCELKSKEQIGVGGWYGFNPTIIMNTMPVKSGRLSYGIGTTENYIYTVSGIGKIGTAEYQTTGDQPVTIYCYVQNISEVRGSNEIEVSIDKTAPTSADFSYSTSGKSITMVASGTDAESGIARYQFSIDGGSTWTPVQSSNTYTFTNLDPIVYTMKARVYNGTYQESDKENNMYKESNTKQVSLAQLEVPTYTIAPSNWTAGNVDVTVHFSKDGVYLVKPFQTVASNVEATTCSHVYNGTYTCDGQRTKTLQAGVWYQVASSPTLTFTDNGSIIAQVSDGLNYKSSSTFNVANIDRVKPVASAGQPSGTAGENGWYKNLTLQIGAQKSGASGISRVYYCVTSGATCNPTTSGSNGQRITIGNNNTGQRVCVKVVGGTGIESDIVCSDAYKVDGTAPTAKFTLNGETAIVTCSDNYGINSGNSGTTWALSGTSNQTKSYTCKDMAGNTYTASYTYKYNSCKTGKNDCQPGYINGDWSSCATGNNSCQPGHIQVWKDCLTGSPNACQGGYKWDSCATTTNTCKGAYSCSSGTLQSNNKCSLLKAVNKTTIKKPMLSVDSCTKSCPSFGGQCQTTANTVHCVYEMKSCDTANGYQMNSSGTWCYKYVDANYDPCATGSADECVAGNKWDNCATTTNTCKGGYVNGDWSECATGSNTCQPGYEQVWVTCATGANTCKGGFQM